MKHLLDSYCEKKSVVVIAGVTASGKSELARQVAELCSSVVVINADSKQVYELVPVITAQPFGLWARDCCRLYSYISLDEGYSVGRWLDDANMEVGGAFLSNRVPILLGGSGLYISSFINGISAVPSISHATKTKVADNLLLMGRKFFYDYYSLKDPNITKVNINDTYRLVKMAEIFEETGKTLAEFHCASPSRGLYDNISLFLIIPEPASTVRSISLRLDSMLKNGVIDEVQELRTAGLGTAVASKMIYGITEINSYLDGKISLDEARTIILTKTVQYAKRQRTWFKNQYKQARLFVSIDAAKDEVLSCMGIH